jgi:hypothetical protein
MSNKFVIHKLRVADIILVIRRLCLCESLLFIIQTNPTYFYDGGVIVDERVNGDPRLPSIHEVVHAGAESLVSYFAILRQMLINLRY